MMEDMAPTAPSRHLPHSPFNAARAAAANAVVEQFTSGDRVTHDHHGMGKVTSVDGAAVYVDFGAGVCRLAMPTHKLHLL